MKKSYKLDSSDIFHVQHFTREVFTDTITAQEGATFLLKQYADLPEQATALIREFSRWTCAPSRCVNRQGVVSLYWNGELVAVRDFRQI